MTASGAGSPACRCGIRDRVGDALSPLRDHGPGESGVMRIVQQVGGIPERGKALGMPRGLEEQPRLIDTHGRIAGRMRDYHRAVETDIPRGILGCIMNK
jgi:hypothetical protein